MELSHKTTILFPPKLHDRLRRLARRRGVSLGQLVRQACARQYQMNDDEAKLEAVRRLASLGLPVDSADVMKRQSAPSPEKLLP